MTQQQICFADIAIATSRYYGIESRELSTRSCARRTCRPRWVAIHLARELTPMSLHALGDKFHRDHSTILYGQRRAAELLEQDPDFSLAVGAVREILDHATPFRKIIYSQTAQLRAAQPLAGDLAATAG